jgi:hypothetical protein
LGVCAASAQSAEKRLVIFTEAGHSDVKSEALGFLWSLQVATFSAAYGVKAKAAACSCNHLHRGSEMDYFPSPFACVFVVESEPHHVES